MSQSMVEKGIGQWGVGVKVRGEGEVEVGVARGQKDQKEWSCPETSFAAWARVCERCNMYMLSFLQRFSDSFKIHEQLKCTLAAIYEYVYPLILIQTHTHRYRFPSTQS